MNVPPFRGAPNPPRGAAAPQDEAAQIEQALQAFQAMRQQIRDGSILLLQLSGKSWPAPIARTEFERSLAVEVGAGKITQAQATAQLDEAKRFTANFEATQYDQWIAAARTRIAQLRAQAGGGSGATNPQVAGGSAQLPQGSPASTGGPLNLQNAFILGCRPDSARL